MYIGCVYLRNPIRLIILTARTHTHTKFKNLKNGGFFNFCSKRIGIMRHTRSHTRLNVYTHTRSTLHKQNMLKHLNNKHKFSYTNTLKLYTYKDT